MLTINQLGHILFVLLSVQLISTRLLIELDDDTSPTISQRVTRLYQSGVWAYFLLLLYMVINPNHDEPKTHIGQIVDSATGFVSIVTCSYLWLKDIIEFHQEYIFPRLQLAIILIATSLTEGLLIHLVVR